MGIAYERSDVCRIEFSLHPPARWDLPAFQLRAGSSASGTARGPRETLWQSGEKDHSLRPTTDVQLCVLNAIWETADVTADGMVSVAEINRLFRIVAGGIGYGDYVISHNDTKSNRRDVPAAEPPENNELDFVIVASSVGAIATPALIANFDYNSDGMLSRTEILGDTDFANLVSEVQKQRRRLPNRIMEAFWRLRGGLFGTTARERDGQVATERRGEEEAQTDRTKLAEFCAEVPQSALCRGAREGQMRTERRGEEDARTDRTKLAEFCAEVPQSALCRDL